MPDPVTIRLRQNSQDILEDVFYDASRVMDDFTHKGVWDRQVLGHSHMALKGIVRACFSQAALRRPKAPQPHSTIRQRVSYCPSSPVSLLFVGTRDQHAAPKVPLSDILRAHGKCCASRVK